MTTSKTAVKSW